MNSNLQEDIELKPIDEILYSFEQIAKIPRCSGNEAGVREWLRGWASQHGFESEADEAGNLVVRVPGTPGASDSPVVVLQAHMDMVCEKNPEVEHDFTRDPIQPVQEGDWLRARGTTLGADNGIGIALALEAAQASDLPHPPLELLFTVSEEVGLNGASSLDPELLQGRILINLDSEEEGAFLVGCAGGVQTQINLNVETSSLPDDWQVFRLEVAGLLGGHSGVDIHKHRGNAIQLLARVLDQIQKRGSVRLLSVDGGTAHNAIPRSARSVFAISVKLSNTLTQVVADLDRKIQAEFARSDPDLKIQISKMGSEKREAAAEDGSRRIIWLLLGLPTGVAEMSADVEGFVETSDNLAQVHYEKGHFKAFTSQRSSVMSRMIALTEKIEAIACLAGAQPVSMEPYPAWQPDLNSKLLMTSQNVFRQIFGREPQVKTIHGGLECGIIGARMPGMDMISIGPTLQNPHCPSEQLNIPSLDHTWQFLTALLRKLSE